MRAGEVGDDRVLVAALELDGPRKGDGARLGVGERVALRARRIGHDVLRVDDGVLVGRGYLAAKENAALRQGIGELLVRGVTGRVLDLQRDPRVAQVSRALGDVDVAVAVDLDALHDVVVGERAVLNAVDGEGIAGRIPGKLRRRGNGQADVQAIHVHGHAEAVVAVPVAPVVKGVRIHVVVHRSLGGDVDDAAGRIRVAHASDAIGLALVGKRLVNELDIAVARVLAGCALGDVVDNEAQLIVGAVYQAGVVLVFALDLYGIGARADGRALKAAGKRDLGGVEGVQLAGRLRGARVGDLRKHGHVDGVRADVDGTAHLEVNDAGGGVAARLAGNRRLDRELLAACVDLNGLGEVDGAVGIGGGVGILRVVGRRLRALGRAVDLVGHGLEGACGEHVEKEDANKHDAQGCLEAQLLACMESHDAGNDEDGDDGHDRRAVARVRRLVLGFAGVVGAVGVSALAVLCVLGAGVRALSQNGRGAHRLAILGSRDLRGGRATDQRPAVGDLEGDRVLREVYVQLVRVRDGDLDLVVRQAVRRRRNVERQVVERVDRRLLALGGIRRIVRKRHARSGRNHKRQDRQEHYEKSGKAFAAPPPTKLLFHKGLHPQAAFPAARFHTC